MDVFFRERNEIDEEKYIWILTPDHFDRIQEKHSDFFVCICWVGHLEPDRGFLENIFNKGARQFIFGGRNSLSWEYAIDEMIVDAEDYQQLEPYPSTSSFEVYNPDDHEFLFFGLACSAIESHSDYFIFVFDESQNAEEKLREYMKNYLLA